MQNAWLQVSGDDCDDNDFNQTRVTALHLMCRTTYKQINMHLEYISLPFPQSMVEHVPAAIAELHEVLRLSCWGTALPVGELGACVPMTETRHLSSTLLVFNFTTRYDSPAN